LLLSFRIEITGKMKQKLILFFLLVIPGLIMAQVVSFSAQAPKQVYVGQRFQLTYTLNSSEGQGFMGPEIVSFDILSGPMMSSGTNIMNINGKLEYTSSSSFTFILEANKAGTFTIPQAIISVKGKRYMSNTLIISVLNQNSRSAQTNPNSNQPQSKSQPQTNDEVGNDVFLKAVVDKNNPYQGELIVVTYKLYTPNQQASGRPALKDTILPGVLGPGSSERCNPISAIHRDGQWQEIHSGGTPQSSPVSSKIGSFDH
jgi:hypothetical protein